MTDQLKLLSGAVVKTETGYFYIKNNVRVRIPNRSVLKSWRFARIIKTSNASLTHYPIMGSLGYRDGSLLWCISDARYYLISGGKRYHIDDPRILKNHKLSFKDAFIVSKRELDLHEAVKV